VNLLRSTRRLVLGETWTLPLGIALAVGLTALARFTTGPDGWFRTAGGLVLLVLVLLALTGSLGGALRHPGRRNADQAEGGQPADNVQERLPVTRR
jgi:hypothetical protein